MGDEDRGRGTFGSDYLQGKDGKQYVVVTATGGGFLGDPGGHDDCVSVAVRWTGLTLPGEAGHMMEAVR